MKKKLTSILVSVVMSVLILFVLIAYKFGWIKEEPDEDIYNY